MHKYFLGCLSFFIMHNVHAVSKISNNKKDSVKIVYNASLFSMGLDLKLMYFQRFYAHPKIIDTGEHYKTIRLDIIHETKPSNQSKEVRNTKQDNKTKILYSFAGNDTLAFSAAFSVVKYDGEYYVIAFPHADEWWNFTPPQRKDGSFLHTPIAFYLDTGKWELTKMKYNRKLKISYIKSTNAVIYDSYKYSHQFDHHFAFSKKLNEFVFGKTKKNPKRN